MFWKWNIDELDSDVSNMGKPQNNVTRKPGEIVKALLRLWVMLRSLNFIL